MNSRIASGAGIAVGGNSPASKAVERAMQTEVMNGHRAAEDPVEMKARLIAARLAAKPAERQ